MRIEHLSREGLDDLLNSYLALTEEAIIGVLQLSKSEARRAIFGLMNRFDHATQDEVRWLLHNDPIVLACDITGRNWNEIDKETILKFNEKRLQMEERLPKLP